MKLFWKTVASWYSPCFQYFHDCGWMCVTWATHNSCLQEVAGGAVRENIINSRFQQRNPCYLPGAWSGLREDCWLDEGTSQSETLEEAAKEEEVFLSDVIHFQWMEGGTAPIWKAVEDWKKKMAHSEEKLTRRHRRSWIGISGEGWPQLSPVPSS